MPSPRYRSRTFRRVLVRVPGNRVSLQYKKRKPSRAHCGSCGRQLLGVPRERDVRIKNLPKSIKRPQRPYGGVLCSLCMRDKLKLSIRV